MGKCVRMCQVHSRRMTFTLNRADPYMPMAGFIFDFNVRECVADTEDPNNKEDISAYISIYGPLRTCGQPCRSVALANSAAMHSMYEERTRLEPPG